MPILLGDRVAQVASFLGFKKKPGCGCDKRQRKLNELHKKLTFRKPKMKSGKPSTPKEVLLMVLSTNGIRNQILHYTQKSAEPSPPSGELLVWLTLQQCGLLVGYHASPERFIAQLITQGFRCYPFPVYAPMPGDIWVSPDQTRMGFVMPFAENHPYGFGFSNIGLHELKTEEIGFLLRLGSF